MTMRAKMLTATAAMSLMTACASTSGAGGVPDPVLGPGGNPSAQKNLILTDISYGHTSNNDGVDQSFDLAVATMVLDKDPISGGLILNEYTRSSFTDTNTMTYDNAANTFAFNISQGNTVMNEVFGLMMLTNPVDRGYTYNDMAIIISANPANFGLSNATYQGNPGAVDAYLASLAESANPADNDLFTSLQTYVENILDSDWFTYSANGITYQQLKLANNAGTTNYTTLGIWYDNTAVRETFGVAVFGMETPSFDMPNSGTASYETTMAGQLLIENSSHFLTGAINFNFDFSQSTLSFFIDADLAETGTNGNVVYLDYDTFTGTGTISGTTFSGNFLSDSDGVTGGTLEGNFFGAAADEVAGTFEFSSTDILGIGGFLGANPDATSQN
ncbi:MAG: transferrin-binding protein-like solute binding protein [bacterium]